MQKLFKGYQNTVERSCFSNNKQATWVVQVSIATSLIPNIQSRINNWLLLLRSIKFIFTLLCTFREFIIDYIG